MSRLPISSFKFTRSARSEVSKPKNTTSCGPNEVTAAGPSRSAARIAPHAPKTTTALKSQSSSQGYQYSTRRLQCSAGYELRPGVIIGMRFELPRVLFYTGRNVASYNENFEVWSPNSRQKPYFAGRMRQGFELIPANRSQHRENQPWLPFARRPPTVKDLEQCSVAFRPVCMEWPQLGCGLNDTFITQLQAYNAALEEQSNRLRKLPNAGDAEMGIRPVLPTEREFNELRSRRIFEEAIDAVAVIQRQLRERDAWISMVRAMTSVKPASTVWKDGYLQANDHLIGVWINDATEEKVGWLLSAAVPVFIVHRYAAGEQRRSNGPLLSSFFSNTELKNRKTKNPFTIIAEQEILRVAPTEMDHGRLGDLIDAAHDRRFSSSSFLEARIQARASSSQLPTKIPVLKMQRQGGNGPRMMATRGPIPPPRDFGPRIVHPSRQPWIEPPPVRVAAPGIQWEKWEMTSESDLEDGAEVILKRNKQWQPEADDIIVWYDRELHREIFIYEDYQIPPGCLAVQKYGCPTPLVSYYDGTRRNRPQQVSSCWMYKTRNPDHDDVHARAPIPEACDLPLIASKVPPSSSTANDQPLPEACDLPLIASKVPPSSSTANDQPQAASLVLTVFADSIRGDQATVETSMLAEQPHLMREDQDIVLEARSDANHASVNPEQTPSKALEGQPSLQPGVTMDIDEPPVDQAAKETPTLAEQPHSSREEDQDIVLGLESDVKHGAVNSSIAMMEEGTSRLPEHTPSMALEGQPSLQPGVAMDVDEPPANLASSPAPTSLPESRREHIDVHEVPDHPRSGFPPHSEPPFEASDQPRLSFPPRSSSPRLQRFFPQELQLNENGKGKGRAIDIDADEVSLGPSSPRKTRLRMGKSWRVPRFHSTFSFVEMMTHVLRSHAGIEMQSVINAQHAIWVCVSDTDSGERAMTFFRRCRSPPFSGEEVLSYESEADFTEAGMYSDESWHPKLPQGDSAAAVPMDVDEHPVIVAPRPRAPPTCSEHRQPYDGVNRRPCSREEEYRGRSPYRRDSRSERKDDWMRQLSASLDIPLPRIVEETRPRCLKDATYTVGFTILLGLPLHSRNGCQSETYYGGLVYPWTIGCASQTIRHPRGEGREDDGPESTTDFNLIDLPPAAMKWGELSAGEQDFFLNKFLLHREESAVKHELLPPAQEHALQQNQERGTEQYELLPPSSTSEHPLQIAEEESAVSSTSCSLRFENTIAAPRRERGAEQYGLLLPSSEKLVPALFASCTVRRRAPSSTSCSLRLKSTPCNRNHTDSLLFKNTSIAATPRGERGTEQYGLLSPSSDKRELRASIPYKRLHREEESAYGLLPPSSEKLEPASFVSCTVRRAGYQARAAPSGSRARTAIQTSIWRMLQQLNNALAVLSVPEHERALWLGKTMQIQSAGNKIDLQRFRTAPPHTDFPFPVSLAVLRLVALRVLPKEIIEGKHDSPLENFRH
ncbi:hypothetical protein B0H13DRAFT_1910890 [Mycena leptocephala]|nr:hypothetical protein B0H13DRAFT_1910890 [Mycena leptocephala]